MFVQLRKQRNKRANSKSTQFTRTRQNSLYMGRAKSEHLYTIMFVSWASLGSLGRRKFLISWSIRLVLCKGTKKVWKKEASSVGIEPTTSRLTVERANRLRHEDLWERQYTKIINLFSVPRVLFYYKPFKSRNKYASILLMLKTAANKAVLIVFVTSTSSSNNGWKSLKKIANGSSVSGPIIKWKISKRWTRRID